MSAENQDQDFEKLQRMLKLKRHEQPPPRFFNNFSTIVTARIRAGETDKKIETFEDVVSQAPWLYRIWMAIEGAGCFGTVRGGSVRLVDRGNLLREQYRAHASRTRRKPIRAST